MERRIGVRPGWADGAGRTPDSVERDREAKPRKYAAAGIAHFWRVEEDEGLPVVHVYEPDDATKSYVPMGIFHNRLEPTVPFPIDIDLAAVDRRR